MYEPEEEPQEEPKEAEPEEEPIEEYGEILEEEPLEELEEEEPLEEDNVEPPNEAVPPPSPGAPYSRKPIKENFHSNVTLFPTVSLLRRVLITADLFLPSRFTGERYTCPGHLTKWNVYVTILTYDTTVEAEKVEGVYYALGLRSSFKAGISDAARNASTAIFHKYRAVIDCSVFQHFPQKG